MRAIDPLRLLSACPPPVASLDLRARALAAARGAMATAPRPTRTDEIYFSTRWRAGWAAVAAIAIAVEIAGSRGGARPSPPSSVPESRAAAADLGLTPTGWMGDGVASSSEPSIPVKGFSL